MICSSVLLSIRSVAISVHSTPFLNCNCDGIILTGGIAYSKRVVEAVRGCVGKLAPVLVYPGEEESTAMVAGPLRILRGEEALIEL